MKEPVSERVVARLGLDSLRLVLQFEDIARPFAQALHALAPWYHLLSGRSEPVPVVPSNFLGAGGSAPSAGSMAGLGITTDGQRG